MNATNTFQNGLIMDSHPLAVSNDALTNCLNGTLITYNGNELILQNDVGNSKIIYKYKDNNNIEVEQEVQLSEGFIPIGMKSFGGIIYIISHNPETLYGEIGTFPSPDYSNGDNFDELYNIHKLQYVYKPLHNLVKTLINDLGLKVKSIHNLTTKAFNFDLEHPVEIDFQLSYDESINIIFNDGKNIPRLINSGFAPYGNNEVKIIKRDLNILETNVYEEENFYYNTSLVRICNSIVNIEFVGELDNGNLPVGNYTFYFKVADSDDNESDFVGLSGLVVCHKGILNDPKSIDGGVADENSNKTVQFKLTKIPRQFTRLYVYYSRYTSTLNGTLVTEYKKITRYFDLSEIKDDNYREAIINITGYDNSVDIGLITLNSLYNNPISANSQAISNNMLFMSGIKLNISLYNDLKAFSREHVLVEPAESENTSELLFDVFSDYKNYHNYKDFDTIGYGYYNIHNIYNKVGYWPEEYYRFGIVYILDDYTTTPVFNIKGNAPFGGNDYNLYGIILFKRLYFKKFIYPNGTETNNDIIHKLQFPKFTVNKDKLPDKVIGYFFVRLKRIKNIIGLALMIGSDQEYSHIPLLWAGRSRKCVAQSFIRNTKYNKFIPNIDDVSDISIGPRPYLNFDENTGEPIEQLNPTESNDDLLAKLNYFLHIGFPKDINIEDLDDEDDWVASVRSIFSYLKSVSLGYSWIADSKNSVLGVESNLICKDAAIMPEFELNLEYYSSIFTGSKFIVNPVVKFNKIGFISNDVTHLSPINPLILYVNEFNPTNIIAVREGTTVKVNNKIYTSIAGNAADPSLYVTPFTDLIFIDNKKASQSSDTIINGESEKDIYDSLGINGDERKYFGYTDFTYHVRGIFSPYLGINKDEHADDVYNEYTLANIKILNNSLEQEIEIRKQDYSEFYPISDRIDVNDPDDKTSTIVNNNIVTKCFRGDCYIGNFTHRMLRNFIDPEFPVLDTISSVYCWPLGNRVANFDAKDLGTYNGTGLHERFYSLYVLKKDTYIMNDKAKVHLNRADVNAVPLGLWITFKYYSSINPCMRSTDGSNTLERATFNLSRKFFPLYNADINKNSNKLSDSYIYNLGYELSLGKLAFTIFPEVPALKEEFSNRIVYSDISIDSLISNNLRTFRSESYEDYTRLYGKIIKLVPWLSSYIIVIFEHGIGYVLVNEKAVVSLLAAKTVYIETNRVLGDLTMLSEKYGSQWKESIIDTPTGIYGVDASAKKIWRYYSQALVECISDLKVNKFLRDNLVTNEISNQINVMTFNVKTHYNAHKQDILFTFYRTLDNGQLVAWNLCYNEVTKKMTTFYSWLPLASENINKTFYSIQFNPETSYKIKFDKLLTLDDKVLYLWEHNKTNNWCNWYGLLHPFEFEYVVNVYPNFLKIFNNLQIISNRAAPESFHFEIVGECYDFSKDKKNMYHRQEATKSFYDWCLSRVLELEGKEKTDFILYDVDAVENVYLTRNLKQNNKSTIFPLMVKRMDFNNIIYDIYKLLTSASLDYLSLSGSEIVYDNTTNDYLIDTHIKAHPKGEYIWQTVCRIDDNDVNIIASYYVNHGIDIRVDGEYLLKKVLYDQRLSNCKYVEDSWKILIPSINYYEKNEDWSKTDGKPPINLVTDPLPEKLSEYTTLPMNEDYPIETESWVTKKQAKIRDKYIKIKIRYSGDDLVIVSGIINTFKETYN